MLSLKVDGRRVRRLREGRGLPVAVVADAAGCSIWTIYKIESGRHQPSPRVYRAMKDLLQAEDADLAVNGGAP